MKLALIVLLTACSGGPGPTGSPNDAASSGDGAADLAACTGKNFGESCASDGECCSGFCLGQGAKTCSKCPEKYAKSGAQCCKGTSCCVPLYGGCSDATTCCSYINGTPTCSAPQGGVCQVN